MLDLPSLLVDMLLNLTHIHALDLSLRLTVWHFDNITATHWAYLKLSKPLSKTDLVEDMTTVGNLLEFLLLVKFFQANGAVIVLAYVFLIVYIIKHPHVSIYYFIYLHLVLLNNTVSLFFKSKSISPSSVFHQYDKQDYENDRNKDNCNYLRKHNQSYTLYIIFFLQEVRIFLMQLIKHVIANRCVNNQQSQENQYFLAECCRYLCEHYSS